MIEQRSGLNLYAYCDTNPLSKVDPNGISWQSIKDFFSATAEAGMNLIGGWFHAIDATAGFVGGTGSFENTFGPDSLQSQQMSNSLSGGAIEQAIADAGWLRAGPLQKQDSSLGMGFMPMGGDLAPFLRTMAEMNNGTQAQVGGFTWNAFRRGNRVHVVLLNKITLRSLLYQYGGYQGGSSGPTGKVAFGTVTQTFDWWIPVPRGQ